MIPSSINPNEIHLWLCESEKITEPLVLNHYQQLLSPEEQTKQKRYRFEKHQLQYLVTRAMIRTLLSHYMPETKAEEWCFEHNEWGRPKLKNEQNPNRLNFNLSHTDGLICCAVTQDHEIGVDVENLLRGGETIKIANRYFSPNEYEALIALPADKQQSRFFDLWTLKESYIKACGMGLAIPLSDFSFTIPAENSHDGILINFVESRADDPKAWRFWSYNFGVQHRIALGLLNSHERSNIDLSKLEVKSFKYVPLLSKKPLELQHQF